MRTKEDLLLLKFLRLKDDEDWNVTTLEMTENLYSFVFVTDNRRIVIPNNVIVFEITFEGTWLTIKGQFSK